MDYIMSLILQSSGGGQITIQEPATASNFTQTLPSASGTVMVSGNQPAFSAYANATQSITTATQTKVAINTELFDTNSNFDTTNNRFTPTVEGYYQVNGIVRCAASSATQMVASIYKNNALYARNTDAVFPSGTMTTFNATVNEIIFMNGTTDYLELYGAVAGSTPTFNFASIQITSRFSACLVRAA